jgi:hypothetical protein
LSYGGRASEVWAKAASFNVGVVGRIERRHRGGRGDTLGKRDGETWETLPCQLLLFKGEFKAESYKAEPKGARGGEGVGAARSSGEDRDTLNLIQGKGLWFNLCLCCREGRPIAGRLPTDI